MGDKTPIWNILEWLIAVLVNMSFCHEIPSKKSSSDVKVITEVNVTSGVCPLVVFHTKSIMS